VSRLGSREIEIDLIELLPRGGFRRDETRQRLPLAAQVSHFGVGFPDVALDLSPLGRRAAGFVESQVVLGLGQVLARARQLGALLREVERHEDIALLDRLPFDDTDRLHERRHRRPKAVRIRWLDDAICGHPRFERADMHGGCGHQNLVRAEQAQAEHQRGTAPATTTTGRSRSRMSSREDSKPNACRRRTWRARSVQSGRCVVGTSR
jgi:hypothetical protein